MGKVGRKRGEEGGETGISMFKKKKDFSEFNCIRLFREDRLLKAELELIAVITLSTFLHLQLRHFFNLP